MSEKRKPHEIVFDAMVLAWTMTDLSKRWKKPGEFLDHIIRGEAREAIKSLKSEDLNKTFRKDYVEPSVDVLSRLKQQFDKVIRKR